MRLAHRIGAFSCQHAGMKWKRQTAPAEGYQKRVAKDCASAAPNESAELVASPRMFTAVAHKNLAAAEGYFDEHLSQNDYYAAGELRPGQWIGQAARNGWD